MVIIIHNSVVFFSWIWTQLTFFFSLSLSCSFFLLQVMPSCYSRKRVQFRLSSMPALRKMGNSICASPVPPLKTNQWVKITYSVCLCVYVCRVCVYICVSVCTQYRHSDSLCCSGTDPSVESERQWLCDGRLSASGPSKDHLCGRSPSTSARRLGEESDFLQMCLYTHIFIDILCFHKLIWGNLWGADF